MKNKEFWKWAGIGFAISMAVFLLVLGVFLLVSNKINDKEKVESSVSISTTNNSTAKMVVKQEVMKPVVDDDSEEKEAVIARIQQFVKAGVESRPNFLSRSTSSMSARWWKSRYEAGVESTERDMPVYYWFKSCKEIIVAISDKDHATAIVSVVESSPWKKGVEQYTFDMVTESGRWQINDIIGKSGSLREKYTKQQ